MVCFIGLVCRVQLLTGKNRQPIPVEEFSEHVQCMHADRDKFFELEYNVSDLMISGQPPFKLLYQRP